MFIMLYIFFSTVGNSGNDLQASATVTMSAILTILDPIFGFFCLILYQHDFLAIRSSNNNDSTFSLGSWIVLALVIDIFIYSAAFIYFECRGICIAQVVSIKRSVVKTFVTTVGGGARLQKQSSLRLLDSYDEDVLEEKRAVAEIYRGGHIDKVNNAIFIHGVNKIYYGKGTVPTKVAVKDVSINVKQGEIFGLLGANGAGEALCEGEFFFKVFDINILIFSSDYVFV
jgi:hypothetical protein